MAVAAAEAALRQELGMVGRQQQLGGSTVAAVIARWQQWRRQRNSATAVACYLSKVICTSIVSVRVSSNTVASRAYFLGCSDSVKFKIVSLFLT